MGACFAIGEGHDDLSQQNHQGAEEEDHPEAGEDHGPGVVHHVQRQESNLGEDRAFEELKRDLLSINKKYLDIIYSIDIYIYIISSLIILSSRSVLHLSINEI